MEITFFIAYITFLPILMMFAGVFAELALPRYEAASKIAILVVFVCGLIVMSVAVVLKTARG